MAHPVFTQQVFSTPQAVAEAAARMLVDEAGGATAEHPRHVALSGGSTPKAMYEVLRQQHANDAKALRLLHYWWGDERSVPNGHEDSNVKLAAEGFLKPLAIPAPHQHPPDGGASDLAAEADRLTRELAEAVPMNEQGVPVFDLIFLGMGGDGHTASLFPGTVALERSEPGFVANEVPQLGTWRLTLTYPVLNAAKKVVVLCTGAGKAGVVRDIFGRGDEAPVYPIEGLRGKNVVWLLDEGAAGA